MDGSAGNAQRLPWINVNRLSVDSPGKHSINPVDRLLVMVMAMSWRHQSRSARHDQLEGRNATRRVLAGQEEMDPKLSESDDLFGRIDTLFGRSLWHTSFLLRGSYIHRANSRP